MELVLDVLITLAGIGSLGLAAWSARGHFQSEKVPLGSMVITLVVMVSVGLNIYLIWVQSQPVVAQFVGLVVMALAIWMFFLTIRASREGRLRMAFDEEGPRGLVEQGPYKYVRHPFYVSYIIFFSAFALATWSPVTIGPLVIIIIIYVIAARMEERLFTNTPMAASYEAYKQRTGFFWPKLSG
jgi:protein-S-isoprenylcysteine O-methyltransferase Ste14